MPSLVKIPFKIKIKNQASTFICCVSVCVRSVLAVAQCLSQRWRESCGWKRTGRSLGRSAISCWGPLVSTMFRRERARCVWQEGKKDLRGKYLIYRETKCLRNCVFLCLCRHPETWCVFYSWIMSTSIMVRTTRASTRLPLTTAWCWRYRNMCGENTNSTECFIQVCLFFCFFLTEHRSKHTLHPHVEWCSLKTHCCNMKGYFLLLFNKKDPIWDNLFIY